MRSEKRIEIFEKYITFENLENKLHFTSNTARMVILDKNKIFEYWKKYYDQRFYQVLINLGYYADGFMWNKEDSDTLQALGVPFEEANFWTSRYDRNNKLLEEPIVKSLSELDNEHVYNILKWFKKRNRHVDPTYEVYFKERLSKWQKFKLLFV